MVALDLPVQATSGAKPSTAIAEVAGAESVQAFAELLASSEAQSIAASEQPIPALGEGAVGMDSEDDASTEITITPTTDPAAVAAIVEALGRLSAMQSTSAAEADPSDALAGTVKSQVAAPFVAPATFRASASTLTSGSRTHSAEAAFRDSQLLQGVSNAVERREVASLGESGADGRDSQSRDESGVSQDAPSVAFMDTVQTKGGADSAKHSGQLNERVGSGAWRDELAAKLTWMVDRGVQSGSLRLNPEHLGPLEVRISVQNDQVSVWFGAAHADTRSALEQALPRLREMFASQGLALADAGVFREPPREQSRDQNYANSGGDSVVRGVAEIGLPQATSRRGLLDAYA